MENIEITAGAAAQIAKGQPENNWVSALANYVLLNIIKVTNNAGSRKGVSRLLESQYRSQTKTLLARLLGRTPTADEIDRVCNW